MKRMLLYRSFLYLLLGIMACCPPIMANLTLLGEARTLEDLGPEEKAAYAWAQDHARTSYCSFASLRESEEMLGKTRVFWWHLEHRDLPSTALDAAVVMTLRTHISSGAGLFLSGFAPAYVQALGLTSNAPSTWKEEGGVSGAWGLYRKKEHPIFQGLPETFPLISDGLRANNRLCWWDNPYLFGGIWLADVERRGNILACGEQILGQGKVIVLGVGAYEWHFPDGVNHNRHHLHRFTANILEYLGAELTDPARLTKDILEKGKPVQRIGEDPIFQWGFEEQQNSTQAVAEQYQGWLHKPSWTAGVKGHALEFDGYSTWLRQPWMAQSHAVSEITIEGWLAVREFPGDDAPLVNQYSEDRGFFLGVDKFGHLVCRMRIGSEWRELKSEEKLPKGRWHHAAMTYLSGTGLCLYLNGALIRELKGLEGLFEYDSRVPLQVGRDCRSPLLGNFFPTGMFNGLLDEIKIRHRALSQQQILGAFRLVGELPIPDLAIPSSRFAGDPQRPIYHAMPPCAWANEPHGLIYHDGLYHLFYQSNPAGPYWNFIRWGHMMSRDLIHWEHRPIAIEPSEGGFDSVGCWSGCSANQDGKLTLVYTGVNGRFAGVGMARLEKDGRFSKAINNPVISGRPEGNYHDFRDPFVWKGTDGWNLIIGSGVPGGGGTVFLYTSEDFLKWNYQGPWFAGDPADSGTFWEMPMVIPFDQHLLFGVTEVPGRCSYWMGKSDGHRFIPTDKQPLRLDLINQFLSPSVARDVKGRYVAIGIIPETRSSSDQMLAGWSHVFSLPREWYLTKQGRLGQRPHPDLKSLRGRETYLHNLKIPASGNLHLSEISGEAMEIILRINPGENMDMGLSLRSSPDNQEATVIYYDSGKQEVVLDRSLSRNERTAPAQTQRVDRASYPIKPQEGLTLHVFLDHSVLECFINDQDAFATRIYPSRKDSIGVWLLAPGGSVMVSSLLAWKMQSLW